VSFARKARELDRMEALRATMSDFIGVTIDARDLMVLISNGDGTSRYKVGPVAQGFYDKHGIKMFADISQVSRTTFYFPQDRKDIAALFKLTFA